MVETSFLVSIAVAFALALVFILRQSSAAPETKDRKPPKKIEKKEKKDKKPPKKTNGKKEKRSQEVKEWVVDHPQKDAQDMLEFLKGKDPVELAKQHNQKAPKKKPQAKKGKEDTGSSGSSAAEEVTPEGFSVIVKKPKKAETEEKKKKKDLKKERKEREENQIPREKPFFKPPPGAEGEVKAEEKPKRRAYEKTADGAERPPRRERPEGERRERPEGERRERPEGERRERPEGERRERPEGEKREDRPERPQRKPTVAPVVKYEQAELSDILALITEDFDKPKTKLARVASIFSKTPRSIVVNILEKVEARDLVALSRVNHYFCGVARKESLWKDILLRDFGVKDASKYRTCRLAYKAEYKKKKAAGRKKKDEEKPAEVSVVAAKEDPKTEEEPAKEPTKELAKEPKQKENNKKKKAESADTAHE